MSTASTLMTFAEFEQLPDLNAGKRELVDGEVIEMPPPRRTHKKVSDRIQYSLADQLDRERVCGDRAGYRMGENWLEPDVSVLWPDQRVDEDDYYLGAPMIAVEVLSPGEEINRKLTLYFENGAAEVWVADYRKNAFTVYVKRGDIVIRRDIADRYHSDAINATIALADIFKQRGGRQRK